VTERRKIDVVFEGNDVPRFTDEALAELLTFDKEGSYDDVEVEESAEAIRRFYQSRGYFEASVTFQRERFQFFERIVFTIQARGRAILGAAGFVTSAQIRHDIERIVARYRRAGFTDAAVHARVSRSQKDRDNAAVLAALVASVASSDGLYITFHIDEGPRTRIEAVRFELAGDSSASKPEELARVVGIRAGAPYDTDEIAAARSKLERHYFQLARPHARIVAETRPGSGP